MKVKVEHGIVNLDGIVDWDYQRTEAEYDVRKRGGVKAVLNELTVRPRVNAGDIRAKLIEAFERSAAAEANRIAVEVVGGKVVLSDVPSPFLGRPAPPHQSQCRDPRRLLRGDPRSLSAGCLRPVSARYRNWAAGRDRREISLGTALRGRTLLLELPKALIKRGPEGVKLVISGAIPACAVRSPAS